MVRFDLGDVDGGLIRRLCPNGQRAVLGVDDQEGFRYIAEGRAGGTCRVVFFGIRPFAMASTARPRHELGAVPWWIEQED